MVPDSATNCYGLEYFCFEGDGLWSASDSELLDLAERELCDGLGMVDRRDVLDGTVVRMPKAYPVYDDAYADNVATIVSAVERDFGTLSFVGRNGMHKYNNQDHAMMTALLTAENILRGERVYDVWRVNQDAEYHEAGRAGRERTLGGGRAVPRRAPSR
jgi:protoporphyrinogen oxidase